MGRHPLVVPPSKSAPKFEKRHVLSRALQSDSRATTPPRLVETVQVLKEDDAEKMFFVKIYGGLDAPGTELLTVSCVNTESGSEVEMRFDEKFPISIRMRNQSDPERVQYAVEQITRGGGFSALLKTLRSVFPKIGV